MICTYSHLTAESRSTALIQQDTRSYRSLRVAAVVWEQARLKNNSARLAQNAVFLTSTDLCDFVSVLAASHSESVSINNPSTVDVLLFAVFGDYDRLC